MRATCLQLSLLLPDASDGETPGHSIGRACVFHASVGRKLLVAFSFVFPLHFIERVAQEHAGRAKPPVALGATEAPKILAFNPF